MNFLCRFLGEFRRRQDERGVRVGPRSGVNLNTRRRRPRGVLGILKCELAVRYRWSASTSQPSSRSLARAMRPFKPLAVTAQLGRRKKGDGKGRTAHVY